MEAALCWSATTRMNNLVWFLIMPTQFSMSRSSKDIGSVSHLRFLFFIFFDKLPSSVSIRSKNLPFRSVILISPTLDLTIRLDCSSAFYVFPSHFCPSLVIGNVRITNGHDIYWTLWQYCCICCSMVDRIIMEKVVSSWIDQMVLLVIGVCMYTCAITAIVNYLVYVFYL